MYSKIGCGMNFLKKTAFLAGLIECNFSSRACRKASPSTTKLHTSSKGKNRKKCRINLQIVSLLVSGVNSDVSMRILWNARLHISVNSSQPRRFLPMPLFVLNCTITSLQQSSVNPNALLADNFFVPFGNSLGQCCATS